MEDTDTPQKAAPLAALREMLTPALSTLLALQIVSGLLVAPLFSLFPVYVETDLHLKATFSGNLRALFVICGAVMAVVGGGVVQSIGRKPAYVLGMTGVVASGGLFLTGSPNVMLALGVYAGLMFGLGSVAGQSYLMDSVDRRSLGLATALFFMTGTAGNAIGNVIAGPVARMPHGYAILGIAIVIGQVVLMVVALRMMPPLAQSDGPRGVAAIAGGYQRLFVRPEIQVLLLLRFFPTVYWGVVTLVLPLLLVRLTGNPASATSYTAVSLVISGVCQVFAGRLVDRYGPRGPVLVTVVTLAAAALANALLVSQVWALVLFGVIGAGAAWSVSVSMTTLIQELSTDETKAPLLGLTHLAWSLGFIAGSLVGGHYASVRGGEPTALLIGAACCIAAILCAAVVLAAIGRRRSEA